MVGVLLPSLGDPSPLQLAFTAAFAAIVAYKLLCSRATHEQYARRHGLTNLKPARRLNKSQWLLGDTVEVFSNASRFGEWLLEKTIEVNEQPWLRRVPTMADRIVIASPTLVEDVTKTQNDVFGKGESARALLGELIGSGFFTQDGETWLHQRKLATRFFSARMFREVATAKIYKHAERLFERLGHACNTGEVVNVSQLLHEFTLETIADLGFGLDTDLVHSDNHHPLHAAMDAALPQVLRRVQLPDWLWKLQRLLDVGGERTHREATQQIRSIVSEMVAKSIDKFRSRDPSVKASNMIELFIQAMIEDDAVEFPPETLRDVAIVFVLAGRGTTSDTLNWILLMLSRHPHVEQKLRQELQDHVPELMDGSKRMLSMEQTSSLVYMEATIKETLRLYPQVPLSAREASRDTHLVDGTFVAKGTRINVATFAMGRLTSVWGDDALEFKPERFVDMTTGKLQVISAFQFFSFHAGPRICVGMNLAMLQMKLVLALLSRFRLHVEPNDGSYKLSATLPLKNPLLARVRPAC